MVITCWCNEACDTQTEEAKADTFGASASIGQLKTGENVEAAHADMMGLKAALVEGCHNIPKDVLTDLESVHDDSIKMRQSLDNLAHLSDSSCDILEAVWGPPCQGWLCSR